MIFLIYSLISIAAVGVERISQVYIDLSKPTPIYLSVGRSSLIDFPCSVISATPGPGKDVEITLAKTNPKELHLFLRSSNSQTTNLIVRCEEAVFIFDIHPSKNNHQDYLQIDGYYGSPTYIEKETQRILEKKYSLEDLYNELKNNEQSPSVTYNEDFGQGRLIQLNNNTFFVSTENILKFGKLEEVKNETSIEFGKGVWVKSSRSSKNNRFLSGQSLEKLYKLRSL